MELWKPYMCVKHILHMFWKRHISSVIFTDATCSRILNHLLTLHKWKLSYIVKMSILIFVRLYCNFVFSSYGRMFVNCKPTVLSVQSFCLIIFKYDLSIALLLEITFSVLFFVTTISWNLWYHQRIWPSSIHSSCFWLLPSSEVSALQMDLQLAPVDRKKFWPCLVWCSSAICTF